MFPNFDCKDIALHNEAQFQSFITNRIASKKIFIKKLSDSDMSYKPCDFFYQNSDGKICAVELKYHYIRDGLSFSKDSIRPNQHASLNLISQGDVDAALLGIYVEAEKEYYILRYSDFRKKVGNKKSLKLSEIKELDIKET